MATSNSHHAVHRFVAAERRQVWARVRTTGEPVYIAEGTADAVRDLARRDWTCIVPDCNSPISVRGGSKRDHFIHLSSVRHIVGPESLDHLASKAMLARWAREQGTPQGIEVIEEQTVKDLDFDVHRRPDVLVSWPGGNRMALEVEYKAFSAAAWAAKQADLNAAGVGCVWLLGHTRIRPLDGIDLHVATAAYPVSVPYLADAIARTGRQVLVVNPVTRQVGTLVGDEGGTTPFRGRQAFLIVDHLHDCTLDLDAGLITPAMRRVTSPSYDAGTPDAQADEEATQGREASPNSPAVTDKWGLIQVERRTAWEKSPHRRRLLERFGRVPDLVSVDTNESFWIHALPVHWHTVILNERVQQRPIGDVFDIDWCFGDLKADGIDSNWVKWKRQRAVAAFLQRAQRHGLVREINRYKWLVLAHLDHSPGEHPSSRDLASTSATGPAPSPAPRLAPAADKTSLTARPNSPCSSGLVTPEKHEPRSPRTEGELIVQRWLAWKSDNTDLAWCHGCQRPLREGEDLHAGHKHTMHP